MHRLKVNGVLLLKLWAEADIVILSLMRERLCRLHESSEDLERDTDLAVRLSRFSLNWRSHHITQGYSVTRF